MEAHRVAASYRLIGPSVEQPEYNLFNRQKMENEYLGIFKTVGLGTTIWSPLATGLLTGKYNNGIPEGSRLSIPGFEWLKDKTLMGDKLSKVKDFQSLADELGTGMAPLAIAWCLRNPNVTTAILGATRKDQLEENFKALDVLPLLTNELMDRIDQIFGTKPRLPDY
jgi:aryl-alcohol dehydrogenase-like predicted oxidoreductase